MSQTPAAAPGARTVRLAVRRRRRPATFVAAGAALAILGAGWFIYAGMFPGQVRSALKDELARPGAPPSLVQFYAKRGYTPLWVANPALQPFRFSGSIGNEGRLVQALATADAPGGRSAEGLAIDRARSGRPADLAHAEIALSLRLANYVARTWPDSRQSEVAFVDPDLKIPRGAGAVLARAAAEPSLGRYVAAVAEVNPVYRRLKEGLAAYRAKWSRLPQIQVPNGATLRGHDQGERVRLLRTRLGLGGGSASFDPALGAAVEQFQRAHGLTPTAVADAPTIAALNAGARRYEQLILTNLERAKALPPSASSRFILVNVPAAQLRYYEGGAMRGRMRVVVGAASSPTPVMAGMLRQLVFNPFWNVPVDMVSQSVAPKVLASGPGYFRSAHLQALSSWDDDATEIDPHDIDWRGVAAGRELRVRQWPGGDNMMGRVKFMLPNELGIYLHDTPERKAFSRDERLMSAGCVRLERAPELAEWLLNERWPSTPGPDRQVDVPQPTPVYITYLTAAPGEDGVEFYPDVYGRSGAKPPAPQPRAAAAPVRGAPEISAQL